MSFADKTITCRDCGDAFTFTSGEQEFYAQKGFDNEPTRCPNCRQSRKQGRSSDRNDSGSGYGSSDRYSSGGYGRGYSGGGNAGGGQREMHTTTCSGCGQPAEVPFVPRGDKPVYCRTCFQSQRSSAPRSNSRW